ncbi:MAG: DUF3667 domain-containing protein [Bacteroidota bacterium]
MASEFIEIIPSFDERLFKTIRPLFMRPGSLTLEYLSGKRKQFLSPFKLYFFISFVFFLVGSLSDTKSNFININSKKSIGSNSVDGNDTLKLQGGTKNDLVNISLQDPSDTTDTIGRSIGNALKRMRSNPTLLVEKFKEYRPKIIFLLLPVFALLLKLLYVRSRHLYIKHIVFAFYFHSVVFFILLLIDLLEFTGNETISNLAGMFYFAIPVHLYFGMKRVYDQKRSKTLIKLTLLTVSYLTIFFITIIAALFAIMYIFY